MSIDMKLNLIALAGILFQFSGVSIVHAQLSSDSVWYQEAISGIRRIYISEIGDNAQIYHGSEYIRNGQKAIGFPYYESDSMRTGSVSYQGYLYPDMHLFYNLVSDEIIIYNYAHDALISLAPGKVDSFTTGAHVFLRLVSGNTNGLPGDGYYEQLFSGEPGVYARREKRLVVGTGSEETKYIQYNYYFIRSKNKYYEVDSKKTLLELLNDPGDLLKKYIRSSKLNFKKNMESSLVLATMYYSRLTH